MTASLEPITANRRGRETPSLPQLAWLSAIASIAAIWVAVLVAEFAAPDMVTGSQHSHFPSAGLDWVWGMAATAFVTLAVQQGIRRKVADSAPWSALAIGIVAVWTGVVFVSTFGPVTVTGTDPTTIPFAAMGAPILGVFLTWFVCTLVKSAFEIDA